MDNFRQTFNIIHHRGSPNEVTTIYGKRVYRQDKIFVPEPYNNLIKCVPYDNHFVYEVDDSIETRGLPSFMCSCGSMAVVMGASSYIEDMSYEGFVIGCYFRHILLDEDTGKYWHKHADGSS